MTRDPLRTQKALLQELSMHCDFITTALNKRREANERAHPIIMDWLVTPRYLTIVQILCRRCAHTIAVIRKVQRILLKLGCPSMIQRVHGKTHVSSPKYYPVRILHTYHDMLLSYYGRENQEDASLRKSPDAIWPLFVIPSTDLNERFFQIGKRILSRLRCWRTKGVFS